MTTIAFYGETIASDSFMDARGIRMQCPGKIWSEGISQGDGIRPWRAFIGIAGDYAYTLKYKRRELLLEGGQLLALDADDMQHISAMAVLVTPSIDPEIYVATITGEWMPLQGRKYHAIGSGCDFALAAMRCGKSALESVQIAAEFDVGTGGAINGLNVRAYKGLGANENYAA
jgi:hypothetical protein